jgi:putative toxin-antitoxin system antitoxin component (TIGR02293 family)
MAITPSTKKTVSVARSRATVAKVQVKNNAIDKFSPAWVVVHSNEAPGYNLELINRIRSGVKKTDWKDLIASIGSTEKEFENILPSSISSMQKKSVYSRETSERIYELARLFGLGFEVFDTKEAFKQWLITPSRALGDKVPFELLDNSFGFELVENEIIRIQHNVYS